MAGSAGEGSGGLRHFDGQETGEALAEWRSSEQLESGTPSTSPSFWDTEDDDEDCGSRPSELYGKYTWKIDKFSQINKRELRSNAFEVGGYKWYILIYPQGCDVCNHLSLFLCVANHDKLLPGWSHFAQFTIAVVNKDPKKSKYSDTLHRFWKKEHDWGWKKFMELSKVLDGFIDADTLIIKAQVQVIREKPDRPFRCLDCQYRRELVRVYLTNVEQICRRFVEESRSKLGTLIEDKARWSSFCAFWLGIDQTSRRSMSKEKTDAILKEVVKQFFIEKEVTSTLVMDSLYSGLKALECQMKRKNSRCKLADTEELPVPVVCVEQEMFVLAEDVLLLLQRVALEPLPPKDDKGPQNRMKDGSSGDDFNKESIERDERRLTELGRRTIEIFVLAHIFSSKIEVAYQEAIALKRQEELIREEAALLEIEHKSKRGGAEKEKKSKKKQGKQKRNNRKGKDKGRDEILVVDALDKLQLGGPDESKDLMTGDSEIVLGKPETMEDVVSDDESDSVDRVPDSEERESSPVNWETEVLSLSVGDGSGAIAISTVQNGIKETNGSGAVDDSSSTCSTDSVPSVVANGSCKANLPPNQESHRSPTRGGNHQGRESSDNFGRVNEGNNRQSDARRLMGSPNKTSGSCKAILETEVVADSLPVQIKKIEQHVPKGEIISHRSEPSVKIQVDNIHRHAEKAIAVSASPVSSSKNISFIQPKSEFKNTGAPAPAISVKRQISNNTLLASSITNSADIAASSRPECHKSPTPKPSEKPLMQEVPVMSRPLSAPIVPGLRPTTQVVSMVQTQPFLSRSMSAVSRLSSDPTTIMQNNPPTSNHQQQSYDSYRNAMMGMHNPPTSSSSGYTHSLQSPSTTAFNNVLPPYAQPANLIYPPMMKPIPSFGMVNPTSIMQNNDIHTFDLLNKQVHGRSLESSACTSGRQSHSVLTDEFPHLDIINDLLDDEQGISAGYQSFRGPHNLNRQFSFPGDISMSNDLVGPSSSSGIYERTQSYRENGFQHGYSSLGSPFDSTTDFFQQPNMRPYANGQIIDGTARNQWQVAGSDLSYLSTRTTEGGGYTYHIPSDYTNMSSGTNGYAVYRPPNGQ